MKARLPRYEGNEYLANPDKYFQIKSGKMYGVRPRSNNEAFEGFRPNLARTLILQHFSTL